MGFIRKLKETALGRRALITGAKALDIFNKLLPKNDKRILFYDSARSFLDDNTEAFYSWLIDNGYNESYELVCCVPNETRKTSQSGYHNISLSKAVFLYLTTKYVFFSFGDFRIKPSRNQVVVNQWHGTPLKRIGKLTEYERYSDERLDSFTWLLSASRAFVPIMAEAFGCDESRVKLIGQCRVDYFRSDKEALRPLGIKKGDYARTFLWMPTFRTSITGGFVDSKPCSQETGLPILETSKELFMLNSNLKDNEALLVVKAHPYAQIPSADLSNIMFVTNEELYRNSVRLYEFIKEFDALITDYSSVYCDYLILDRPICFTIDDIDDYRKGRGFIFDDIEDFFPGHHVRTFEELLGFIHDVSIGADPFKNERRALSEVLNDGNTTCNCKALADLCGIEKKCF